MMLASLPLALLAMLSGEVAAGPKAAKKPPRARPCLDLPDEVLEQMFGRLSVGVLSAFHHALHLEPTDRRNVTCPSARGRNPSLSSVPVNLLSVSPWAYRITHDPARYPRFIPEAYCLCRGCLTGPLGTESRHYRSVPVYMPTAILRRSGICAGGRHSYTESYVSIAVGCTCLPLLKEDAQTGNQSRGRASGENKKHNHSEN